MEDICRLRGGVEALHSACDGRLRVGTACAGTDLFIGCLESVVALWEELFGISFGISHCFSCENVDFKQDFILDHWNPELFFPDLMKLHLDSTEDIRGRSCGVPPVDVFVCGIECDSISALSCNASKNRTCIELEAGRTGSTAAACMRYVRKHRPAVWIAENVKSLATKGPDGKSNLSQLITLANEVGYLVRAQVMETQRYGLPQSRSRYYLVGVLVSPGPVNQLREKFEWPGWVHGFDALLRQVQVPPVPFERVVLPNGHELVELAHAARPLASDSRRKPKAKATASGQRAAASAQSQPAAAFGQSQPAAASGHSQEAPASGQSQQESKVAVPQYHVDHLEKYMGVGLAWPPEAHWTPEFEAKTQCLSNRMREILWYVEHQQGPARSLKSLSFRDLNMTIGWSYDWDAICPCIVSTSTLWVRGTMPATVSDQRAATVSDQCAATVSDQRTALCDTASGQAVQCVDHVLTGEEALALQGFDYTLQSRAPDLHKWSQKEKIDLAGNAFSASSVLPLLVALATWAPLPAAFEARVSDQGEVTAYGQQDSMDGVALSQASDGAEEGGEEETQSQPDSVHSCESGVSVAD